MGEEVRRKAPHIRFKGFTDEWEQRTVEEISDVFDGTHQTPKYTESGIKFVSVENIATLETMKFISQEAYDKEYSKKQAEKGDILMTRIGDIGTTRVIEIEEPLAYYVTLALLKPKHVNSNFLAWLISSPEVQRSIWKRTLHIAFPKKINLGEINKVELMVPNIDEQDKIGAFFKELENISTLHQRKLDLLKVTKKSMLQKMFPQYGESVPEIRFKGFTDAWKQCKFSELYQKINEKNDLSFGTDKIISVANMYYKKEININSTEEYMRTYNIFRLGDIAFEGNKSKDYSYGRFVENDIGDGIVSHVFDVFRPIARYDLWFWKYLINNENVMGHVLRRVTTKATMMNNLVAKDFLNATIFVPNIEEQERIGEYFKQYDNLINIHQDELDLLKDLKKSILQQMFI